MPEAERRQIRKSAAIIVSSLLDKLYTLVEEEAQEPSPGRPTIGPQWPNKVRAAMRRGSPDLDRGWFYYGILDCLSQLSGLTDINTLHHKGILNKMKKLIFGDESPEYRWKAVSTTVLMYLMIRSIQRLALPTNSPLRSKCSCLVTVIRATTCMIF